MPADKNTRRVSVCRNAARNKIIIQVISGSAFDYKVHESAFNDNGFNDFFALNHFRNRFVCERDSLDFVFRCVFGNVYLRFNLAVELYGEFYFVLNERVFVANGIRFGEYGFLLPLCDQSSSAKCGAQGASRRMSVSVVFLKSSSFLPSIPSYL